MTTTKAKPGPWADEENRAICELYFQMLDAATEGRSYNKAAMIRKAQYPEPEFRGPLWNRSRGSIEAKLMNCSAAHRDLREGHTTMDGYGYRALSNYQASLKATMTVVLQDRYFDRPMQCSIFGDAA